MAKNTGNFKTIVIQGLGLIGGSLAHLIREVHPDACCIGVDTNPDAITYALDKGMIQKGFSRIEDVQDQPDLAVFCTPLETLQADIIAASQHFTHAMILTDVGSVKSSIHISVEDLKADHVFIPGHPMAGTEHSGIASSDADILKEATYLLIGAPSQHGDQLANWLSGLSFNPLYIAADDHDKWVALASHIPYLMASLTVSTTLQSASAEPDPLQNIVSSGFRDTTRVASMSPEWGASICTQNKPAILEGLETLSTQLDQLKKMIQNSDSDALKTFFKTMQTRRNTLLNR